VEPNDFGTTFLKGCFALLFPKVDRWSQTILAQPFSKVVLLYFFEK